MGRLMLNVLLSFAQFEREVTGERIQDKIIASKKKGVWMGGIPPLAMMSRSAGWCPIPGRRNWSGISSSVSWIPVPRSCWSKSYSGWGGLKSMGYPEWKGAGRKVHRQEPDLQAAA